MEEDYFHFIVGKFKNWLKFDHQPVFLNCVLIISETNHNSLTISILFKVRKTLKNPFANKMPVDSMKNV